MPIDWATKEDPQMMAVIRRQIIPDGFVRRIYISFLNRQKEYILCYWDLQAIWPVCDLSQTFDEVSYLFYYYFMRIKEKYTWLEHLDFMIVDILSLLMCFVISYRIKFGDFSFIYKNEWHLYLLVIVLLNISITLFTNPYSGIFKRSYYQEGIRALTLAMYNLLVAAVFFYLLKIGAAYSREMTIWMYSFYFITSLIFKYAWKKLRLKFLKRSNIAQKIPLFIVGSSKTIEETLKNVNSGDFQLYDIKGIYLTDSDSEIEGIPTVHEDYVKFVLDNNIEEVLISVKPSEVSEKDCERLSLNGIEINLVIENSIGFMSEDQSVQSMGVYPVLSIRNFSFTQSQLIYLRIKRLLDIFCGLIGLVLLLPITLFVKIATLASGDKAKIFYRQNRIGKNGKIFRMWKFRTMVPDSDAKLEELLKQEEYRKQWEENQKIVNDPRITRVGRFLRKTSIDEMPQLINVFLGDMSLVGPRPLIVNELSMHDGLKLYQKVKPGITGWWGCNGRSNIEYRERLELEYYYVKNVSFYLDVLCLVRTLFAVINREGAE